MVILFELMEKSWNETFNLLQNLLTYPITTLFGQKTTSNESKPYNILIGLSSQALLDKNVDEQTKGIQIKIVSYWMSHEPLVEN